MNELTHMSCQHSPVENVGVVTIEGLQENVSDAEEAVTTFVGLAEKWGYSSPEPLRNLNAIANPAIRLYGPEQNGSNVILDVRVVKLFQETLMFYCKTTSNKTPAKILTVTVPIKTNEITTDPSAQTVHAHVGDKTEKNSEQKRSKLQYLFNRSIFVPTLRPHSEFPALVFLSVTQLTHILSYLPVSKYCSKK